MTRQWVLIDADDTLWENNIYFEQAFDEFVQLLDHPRLSSAEVRGVLDSIEVENIPVNGYGAQNFGRNMQQCFRQLVERPYTDEDALAVMQVADRIAHQPMKIFDGVEETLAYLGERHHMTLCSKGHPEEQNQKIDRSGLRRHFDGCHVVREKDAATYRGFVEQMGMEPEKTWMVGNSPKSDINPALAVGLGAVLVPHANTWSLELEEIPPPSQRFVIVSAFADLRQLF